MNDATAAASRRVKLLAVLIFAALLAAISAVNVIVGRQPRANVVNQSFTIGEADRKNSNAMVRCLEFNHDGSILYAGMDERPRNAPGDPNKNGEIVAWSCDKRTVLASYPTTFRPSAITVSPDAQSLVVGVSLYQRGSKVSDPSPEPNHYSQVGSLIVLDPETLKERKTIDCSAAVNDVRFSPRGDRIVALTADTADEVVLRIWSWPDLRPIAQLKWKGSPAAVPSAGPTRLLDFSADGRRLFVSTVAAGAHQDASKGGGVRSGNIRVISTRAGVELGELAAPGPVQHIDVDDAGEVVACTSIDQSVVFRVPQGGVEIAYDDNARHWFPPDTSLRLRRASADSGLFVSRDPYNRETNGEAYVLDWSQQSVNYPDDRRILRREPFGETHYNTACAVTDSERRIAIGNDFGQIVVWDLPN